MMVVGGTDAANHAGAAGDSAAQRDSGGRMRSGRTAPPEVGEPARPLDLPRLGGGRVRVPDPEGRIVLLSFLRHAG